MWHLEFMTPRWEKIASQSEHFGQKLTQPFYYNIGCPIISVCVAIKTFFEKSVKNLQIVDRVAWPGGFDFFVKIGFLFLFLIL
jgi:hypothetical protein